MAFLALVLSAAVLAGCVELVFRLWARLPPGDRESESDRDRWLAGWAIRGLGIPLGVWFVANLGVAIALPPLHPGVEALRYSGRPWFGACLAVTGIGAGVIASYWAAVSMAWLLGVMIPRVEDPRAFRRELLIWSALTLPLSALGIYLGGALAGGVAATVWLAGTAHGTLPLLPIQRTPTYSLAIARMKFGKYAEAEKEVLAELDRCKSDYDGWMLLAELYAVHFREFEQAEQTIIDLCEQPGTTPSQAAAALHRLADWHLELRDDPQSARRCLAAIPARFPGTLLARLAEQRRQRLPETSAELLEQRQTRTLHLPALHDTPDSPTESSSVEAAPTHQRIEVLTQRLARDPDDLAHREELARLFARLRQTRRALEHLDLLLGRDDEPATRRAEWLGLKATWLRQESPGDPRVPALLSRIVAEFPNTPQAHAARRHLQLMEEEARAAKTPSPPPPPRIVVRLQEDPPPANGPAA